MDQKRFRQWSPPVVAGANVSPGTIISKAISAESNYDWDPKRQQFRSKKVIEMEGKGEKVPKPSGSPKKKPSKPKTLQVEQKREVTEQSPIKHGPKKIEEGKPFVGPKSNKQMGDEYEAKQKEGPKLLPAKTATSQEAAAPKAKKQAGKTLTLVAESDPDGKTTVKKIEPKSEKKINSISSPEVRVSKPSPKPGPQPIGTGAGVMTSSTGGPQLTGHNMPRTVLGETKKAVAGLDELATMSKAKFKTGTGQVGKRKAGEI